MMYKVNCYDNELRDNDDTTEIICNLIDEDDLMHEVSNCFFNDLWEHLDDDFKCEIFDRAFTTKWEDEVTEYDDDEAEDYLKAHENE